MKALRSYIAATLVGLAACLATVAQAQTLRDASYHNIGRISPNGVVRNNSQQSIGFFDNDGVCNEVVGKAMEIMEEDAEIGAFLLECSDMPPYAYAIQAATQRPVFDFISMIKFLKMSVTQKAYCGWI